MIWLDNKSLAIHGLPRDGMPTACSHETSNARRIYHEEAQTLVLLLHVENYDVEDD